MMILLFDVKTTRTKNGEPVAVRVGNLSLCIVHRWCWCRGRKSSGRKKIANNISTINKTNIIFTLSAFDGLIWYKLQPKWTKSIGNE